MDGGEGGEEKEEEEKKVLRREDLSIGETLGEGSFADVRLATVRATGERVALKVMEKKQIAREHKVQSVKNERTLLGMADFRGIIKLLFTFQDDKNLYVALELAEGGELFQQIQRRGPFPHELASFYAAEIVETIEYLRYSLHVVHRDLKPENVLLTMQGHIKLGDFGSAKLLDQEVEKEKGPQGGERRKRTMSFVGTAEYVSPEVLTADKGGITYAADLWALGCIIFQMLVGRPPFRGESEYLTFQKVLARDFGDLPEDFPSDASDLIDKLLRVEPSERLGAREEEAYEEVRAHPFFAGVEWGTLWEGEAPMALLPKPEVGEKYTELNIGDISSRLDEVIASTKEEESVTVVAAAPAGPLKGKDKWRQFCDEEGEEVLRYGTVRKHRGLLPKKRQLILTSKPRIIYVDASAMVVKGSIDFVEAMTVEVKDDFFTVKVPDRDYIIEDLGKDANGWATRIGEEYSKLFPDSASCVCGDG